MIKALIFDCFGVVVTETLTPFRDRYFSHDKRALEQLNDMTKAVDLGFLSKVDYHREISRLCGLSEQEIYNTLENGSTLDTRMIDVIKSYKPRYKIGMLSNVSPRRIDDFLSSQDKKLFDDLALSYELGVTKPDYAAYRAAAERLGVSPEECVFIDDQERNVTAACEVGMRSIHYKNFAQFERELKKLLQ
ncbi:MAG TPA: HAD-IA family hydrolase [Candidatus Saccharibacteria bacterium]|nr:HAD-IA family hydrolase [Candidatus Saccharibacteria bacterium]